MRNPDDECLRRIQTICSYHDLAEWRLQYTSEDNSWGFTLTVPLEEPQQEVEETPFGMSMMLKTHHAPSFAMRCQSLVVLAEALEHWQAHQIQASENPDA